MAYIGKIFTKSPYYITEVGAGGFTSILEIRIWSGASASPPASATYTLVKQAIDSLTTLVTFEISKLIADDYIHNGSFFEDSVTNGEHTLWCEVKSFGGSTNRTDLYNIFDGYTSFIQGVNYSTPVDVAIPNDFVYVETGATEFNVPILIENSNSVDYVVGIDVDGNEGAGQSITTDTNSWNKLKPLTLTYGGTVLGGGKLTGYRFKDGGSGGTVLKTITIEEIECGWNPVKYVRFLNRYGAIQEIPLFGKSTSGLSVEKNNFKKQLLDYSSGTPTYNTEHHQYKDYGVVGRTRETLNTGRVDTEYNETITDLINSDYVWFIQGSTALPVNVVTQDINFLNDTNDTVINYSIEFEYSFNNQNLVY